MPNISSVLLQTANVVIENTENNKKVKEKCLLEQGVQMNFWLKE